MIGKTLGHYEILEPLGAGGMGEVYRARDTKLDRDVAVKVLPEDFATDQERLARFEREAKLLASLNHANIAAIYGLEDEGDQRFIVMEVVEGETIAERISRSGSVELDEALDIARQIAEALEAAHENGVIHRDLKPANVIVTPEGNVKVLDFGLAKAYAADGSSSDVSPDLSHSPTMAAATRTGVILGTAAYMSPEQARGKPVDKRTDIWAFGCVVYEMLTGRRAFDGEDVSETLAAVLRDQPDYDLLPSGTPDAVRTLLERCLTRDPRLRLQAIGEARIALDSVSDGATATALGDLRRSERPAFARLALLGAGVAIGALGAWIVLASRVNPASSGDPTGASPPQTAGVVDLSGAAPLGFGEADIGFDSPLLAVSPDGEWLVYVGASGGNSMLYRHRLDGFTAPEPIPGTEGAIHPFFSPTGERVGFLTDDRLKAVSLNGDDLQPISPVRTAVRAFWTRDDWIYFSNDQGASWRRIRPGDAAAEDVVFETPQGWMDLTDVHPDGRWALAAEISGGRSSYDHGTVAVLDLQTKQRVDEFDRGYDARFAGSAHVIFSRGGNLFAARFDAESGRIEAAADVIERDVGMDSLFGNTQVAISASGTLAYVPGGDLAVGRVVSVDRDGGELHPLALEPHVYGELDLSPDDESLAIHVFDVEDYVSIYDIDSATPRKVPGTDGGGWPKWNHDGSSVVWASGYADDWRVLATDIDAGGDARVLAISPLRIRPSNWLPDGSRLLVAEYNVGGRYAFVDRDDPGSLEWYEDAVGSGVMLPFLSPDGRFLSSARDETGMFEIWIHPYPDGAPRQFSTGGGTEHVWCPCGEIVYRQGTTWYAKKVVPGADSLDEPAVEVFRVDDFIDTPGRSFDISSDAQQLFVVQRARPRIDTRIHVVGNWLEELERLIPLGGSQ